jgi:hypothetical protein
VVVVSDGRVRDPEKVAELADPGTAASRSTSCRSAAPPRVMSPSSPPSRQGAQAQVEVDVFLRLLASPASAWSCSFRRSTKPGRSRRSLTTLPVTLQDGVQPLTVAFRRAGDEASASARARRPRDLAPANNDFPLEVEIDRTKIRVLLLEGSADLRSHAPGRRR